MVGGTQRTAGVGDRRHDVLYTAGVVAELTRNAVEPRLVLPGGDASIGHAFTGVSRDGAQMLLCRQRDLLWVDPGTWTVEASWTHPLCNDVHHALVHEGRLVVASTGADAILVDADGAVRAVDVGAGAARSGDLRRADLRPHAVHPNHLFALEGSVWATRFHQRDAVCIDGPGRLDVALERLHDGVVHDGCVWFTTVDGRLVAVEPGGALVRVVDLQALTEGTEPAGWCRGLCFVGGVAYVGFTRIRATRWRSHLAWVRGRLRGRPLATRRPTRVVACDLESEALVGSWPTSPAGIDAVFGLAPA